MPAFRTGHPRCRVHFTADEVLTAGAHVLSWDATVYDDESLWDGATDIVCSRAGLWWVGAAAYRLSGATGNFAILIRPQVNGSAVMDARGQNIPGTNSANIGSHLELAVGDAISLSVTAHNASTSTLDDGFTWLEAIRVGPVRYAGN